MSHHLPACRLTDAQKVKIVQMYLSGATTKEVGSLFQVTDGTVNNILSRRGIARRAHGVRGIKVRQLSETDKAYVAGIVDGEGGIEVRYGLTRDPSGRVTIWNTYKPLIDWLTETIGMGTVTSRIRSNAKVQGTKPCYLWEISSRQNVAALLQQLLPYLKIKKEKAETLLSVLPSLPSRNL
jgi:hypothetical protein